MIATWGKQGPELIQRRLALYGQEQRMVFGASTYIQKRTGRAGDEFSPRRAS